MAAKWIETITGSFEEKKRYRRYRERVSELPGAYRTALEAVERYLMYAGIMKGDAMVDMFEDLLELFEQSVESATPVRGIVGEDPVEFAEAFLRNYSDRQWIGKERARLTDAIARAESDEEGAGS
ncbi:DUF1048 domain-containing protein [Leucobacter sp. CSA1]|uniref:DUF1048 domain-containing protein n=1 Tax=Leucobacter chromiisoli TaxID=2796471 RepID=A0A934Q8M8_9MICO|nr:DUF1048 domain-containing protein [Leucobacter chromiisoli]MBK0419320.1 DUF1048 domain-containing protein [Leucobacter chromiisoli]